MDDLIIEKTYPRKSLLNSADYAQIQSSIISLETENPDSFLLNSIKEITLFSGNKAGFIFRFEKRKEELTVHPSFMERQDNLNKLYAESLHDAIIKFIKHNKSCLSISNHSNHTFFPFSETEDTVLIAAFTGGLVKHNHEDTTLLISLVKFCWTIYKKAEDVTCMKMENSRLLKNIRLKNEYMMNTAHQIRTPLNAITGFSGLLAEAGHLSGEELKYIGIIHESAEELLTSINDFEEYATFDPNSRKLNITKADIGSIVSEVIENNIEKAFRNRTEINNNISIHPGSFTFYTDAMKLHQIINTMISIALRYTVKGKVEISVEINEGILVIEVSGNGDTTADINKPEISKWISLKESDGNRIPEDLTDISGIYLLQLCGSQKFKPGKNEFILSIEIPSSEIPKKNILPPERPNDFDGNKPGKKILIAEDDDNNYLLIMSYLENSGVKLVRARNGKEAVDLCNEGHFDLVLMDLKMPVMDGFNAIKHILDKNPGMKIIIQSAFLGDKDKVFESGCTDFIAKPFRKQQLLSIVHSYI
jgi:CheY-like chemotaxis protein